MLADLSRYRGDEAFQGSPHPMVVLDDELVFRAANRAYLRLVGRAEDEVVALGLLEAFPPSGEPQNHGPEHMVRACTTALRRRTSQQLLAERYDIEDPATGEFRMRYWVPFIRPLCDGGRTAGVRVRVDEVPAPRPEALELLHVLSGLVLPTGGPDLDDEQADRVVEVVSTVNRMADEVAGLRWAMTSRAAIEQAKGIVMAERHCDPDEAFAAMVRISNETNTKVADLARALVEQTIGPPAGAARAPEPGEPG